MTTSLKALIRLFLLLGGYNQLTGVATLLRARTRNKFCTASSALLRYGFDSGRAGKLPLPDQITTGGEIQCSDFMIADLTHANNGAYWEAGYAEGLGKPVIYTCEKEKFNSQKTHFDTNHHLTVLWDKDAPEQAGELLKATIRATLPQLAKLED